MRPRRISSVRADISSAECGEGFFAIPPLRMRLRSSVLMRFKRFRTFVFLIPGSSVGTAPHLILGWIGLQIVI